MAYNVATGAYTNVTGATGQVAGNIIQSTQWNNIHSDQATAFTQVYQQLLSNQSVYNNVLWGNGGFEVWQRGAGNSSSFANVNNNQSTGQYTADRWYLAVNTSTTMTVSAQAGIDTPNQSNSAAKILRANTASVAGTTNSYFAYPLDTYEINQLIGQKAALSFWVKPGANWSPVSGTLSWSLYVGTGAVGKRGQNAYTNEQKLLNGSINLTAGAAAALVVASLGTVVCTTAATQGEFQFFWNPQSSAVADDSIQFDNVMLTAQQSATTPYTSTFVPPTYDHLPWEVCLYNCKQHYQKTFPYAVAPAQSTSNYGGALAGVNQTAATSRGAVFWIYHPNLRGQPAITTYNVTANNANWTDVTAQTTVAVNVTATSSLSTLFIWTSTSTSIGDALYIHAQADAGI
jgi:hypothetical protein